jgi:outer membrane lipoprotein-sorting protein
VVDKNKILIKFIVILLGFSNLSAQESAVDLLQRVNKNVLLLDNVYYKFEISSKFENSILPISGEFYIKQESYLIDTNEIDQIYDGEKFYTIIHENKEIIISTENTSFFNFSPNQIFNFFLKGFDLKRQNISNDKYFIAAESIEEEEIIYNLFINSNLSIEKIEMIEKETGEEINKFLTLTYDYNLNIPLSLFKFDINDYEDYLIVKEN